MNSTLYTISCTSIWLLITSGCIPTPHDEDDPNANGHINVTDDGAWCWFSDPRAIYYEGIHQRTYAGWVTENGSIEVGFYDHDLDSLVTKTIDEELQIDDHNNPSLHIDNTGRLMVFYSKHANKNPIFLARARHPESIDEWGPLQELALNDSMLFPGASNTYTYTNVCQLADEKSKLYLFWRGVDFKPNFSISLNQGQTWSTGKTLVLPERIYSNRRPYLKVGTNNKDVIHLAFTDGHPRDEPTNSIYYAQYKKGELLKADGSKIKPWSALPVSPAESDLVYDAAKTGERAWIWDVAGDSQDRPVLVYSRFPNDSTHLYYYALWKESGWENIKLINSGDWFPQTRPGETEREPNYSGGIALDHSNPSIVYLSVQRHGVFEIEKWETADYGKSWITTKVTNGSRFSNVRPVAVRNRPSEYSTMVLWMNFSRYVHYTEFESAIRIRIEGMNDK